MKPIEEILDNGSVLPVCVISDPAKALPLAECFMRSGIKVMEVTLRTPAAIAAIDAIARGCPDMVVGAGTVRRQQDIQPVINAGARFLVTPGTTHQLIEEMTRWDIAVLPAAATVSESMQLMEHGYNVQKLFPAEQLGGLDYLRTVGGPLPDVAFCPSGGVTVNNYRDYLAAPNVYCVSGSWVAPEALVTAGDWAEIERRVATTLAQ